MWIGRRSQENSLKKKNQNRASKMAKHTKLCHKEPSHTTHWFPRERLKYRKINPHFFMP
jgi:hypothetical protein